MPVIPQQDRIYRGADGSDREMLPAYHFTGRRPGEGKSEERCSGAYMDQLLG